MEAKDTAMSLFQRNKFHNWGEIKAKELTSEENEGRILLAQAEITAPIFFEEGKKAGIREVVEWINTHTVVLLAKSIVRFYVEKEWQTQLREWFKDNPELLKEWGVSDV